jgi:DDE superfamily endonuclease
MASFCSKNEGILYLLLENYPAHCTIMVRDAFSRCQTEIDYVPSGYISRLQVMDVGVNKPFKCYACNIFDDLLVQQSQCERDVSLWISTAWEETK